MYTLLHEQQFAMQLTGVRKDVQLRTQVYIVIATWFSLTHRRKRNFLLTHRGKHYSLLNILYMDATVIVNETGIPKTSLHC